MKLTVIYAFPHNTSEWSTPSSLYEEFRLRGWEIELVNIKDERNLFTDQYLKQFIESDSNPDIILFMDWGRFDSPYLDKKLKPSSFWIQESGDDPQNFIMNSKKADRFHFTFTPDFQSYQKYINMGINAEWLTHFADTRIHKPYRQEKEYIAVTSRGIGGSEFLDYLTAYGEGSIGNKNGFNGEEHSKFLCSGLMVVQNSRHQEITRRVFEGACCGQLVLTDRLPTSTRMEELLQDEKHVVYYNDMADLINKINYYAEHEVEREAIAQAGREHILSNFTQAQVVDKLIERWKSFQ